MGCLKSLETPLCVLITFVFLAHGLYSAAYKVIESEVPLDEKALDPKDMLMLALAFMSLVGICSSRRAFGVFTLIFMLHAFLFAVFHVFHVVSLFIRSLDNPCKYHVQPVSGTDAMCHALNGFTIVCTVISMIASALASMAVFVRLTTVVVHISDLRGLSTSRSFDNSLPRLIRNVSIESERDEEMAGPKRKMGIPDLFV